MTLDSSAQVAQMKWSILKYIYAEWPIEGREPIEHIHLYSWTAYWSYMSKVLIDEPVRLVPTDLKALTRIVFAKT